MIFPKFLIDELKKQTGRDPARAHALEDGPEIALVDGHVADATILPPRPITRFPCWSLSGLAVGRRTASMRRTCPRV
jgi:hypothetical protein